MKLQRGERRGSSLRFLKTQQKIESGVETKQREDENSKNSRKHSTASGSVELKSSWFNFAAPPKTPISRKIDFTKLDWNLLSTASPSIDAWLNPMDRLQTTGSGCYKQLSSEGWCGDGLANGGFT